MSEGQSISLEPGECVTLAPESSRLKGVYKQVRPRSADEVRELLSLTGAAAEAAQKSRICCGPDRPPAATPAAEDLDDKDDEKRANARGLTYQAFRAYVHGDNPAALAHLKPAFDRYLELSKAIINIAYLQDIEVADGATLTISASTHVVNARKVIIHRTGRIVCRGSTTFKIVSLEGTRPLVATQVGAAAATSFQATHR
jgi:hypothetical protein